MMQSTTCLHQSMVLFKLMLCSLHMSLNGEKPQFELNRLAAGGNMWISADESEAISATLLPKLKKTWRAHEDLLFEAITLQVAVCNH